MDIKFKLLLVLPLVVCTGYPHDAQLTPYVGRLASLMGDVMLFIMYTGSLNYDAYFITPALISLQERDFAKNGFLDFFAEDFRLTEHAKDFYFSKNETKEEFAKRFFHYIANAENVPSKTRELAAKFATHFEPRPYPEYAKGFISPCPLYSFVRALTLLKEADKLGDVDDNSVEVVIKFLLTEFQPLAYDIEDNASVNDIVETLGHGLSSTHEPLKLTDGSIASQHNKELFERLATEESVPQNVKDAIADILSHM